MVNISMQFRFVLQQSNDFDEESDEEWAKTMGMVGVGQARGER